eukprot:768056-Hanusia_phi.AAC.3
MHVSCCGTLSRFNAFILFLWIISPRSITSNEKLSVDCNLLCKTGDPTWGQACMELPLPFRNQAFNLHKKFQSLRGGAWESESEIPDREFELFNAQDEMEYKYGMLTYISKLKASFSGRAMKKLGGGGFRELRSVGEDDGERIGDQLPFAAWSGKEVKAERGGHFDCVSSDYVVICVACSIERCKEDRKGVDSLRCGKTGVKVVEDGEKTQSSSEKRRGEERDDSVLIYDFQGSM